MLFACVYLAADVQLSIGYAHMPLYYQDGDFVVHSRHEAAENMHDGFRRLWISYRASDADTGDTLSPSCCVPAVLARNANTLKTSRV
jgi:hypothetical protein